MKLSELILILLQCDEKDKQNIQLTGYNERQARNKERQVVSVKQECASCSKFSPGIFTAFKMACLTYNPSKINYKDRVLTRD